MDETADAGVSDIITEIKDREKISASELEEAINAINKSDKPYWGNQISFHSKRAVQACIRDMKIIDRKFIGEREGHIL